VDAGDARRQPRAHAGVDLDDLAVAIRAIYGPESHVTGKLVAVDGDAIVIETGAEKFGECCGAPLTFHGRSRRRRKVRIWRSRFRRQSA